MCNFAIPGFQTPTSPNAAGRVVLNADGMLDFPFATELNPNDKLPAFTVYISAERGREINRLAWSTTSRFIYEKRNGTTGLKEFWFKIYPDELTVLPGTYVFRFVAEGKDYAVKSVTIPDSPANELSRLPNHCGNRVASVDRSFDP